MNHLQHYSLGLDNVGAALLFAEKVDDDRNETLSEQGGSMTSLTLLRSNGGWSGAYATLVDRDGILDPEQILIDREAAREDHDANDDGYVSETKPVTDYEYKTRSFGNGHKVLVRRAKTEKKVAFEETVIVTPVAPTPVDALRAAVLPLMLEQASMIANKIADATPIALVVKSLSPEMVKATPVVQNTTPRGSCDVSALGLTCRSCHKPIERLPFFPKTNAPVNCPSCHRANSAKRQHGAHKVRLVTTVDIFMESFHREMNAEKLDTQKKVVEAARITTTRANSAPRQPQKAGTHGHARRYNGVGGAFGKNRR